MGERGLEKTGTKGLLGVQRKFKARVARVIVQRKKVIGKKARAHYPHRERGRGGGTREESTQRRGPSTQ